MKVSVIIITKNQRDLLKQSLPILLNQKIDGKYEIIVVDSGSTDGAKEYISSLPVKLIEIESNNFNFANAFNTGANNARGEFLLRLSGDVIPQKADFLEEMIKPFGDKNVGGVYGKYTQTGKKGYSHPNFWPPERFPNKMIRFSMKPNFFALFDNNYSYELTSFAGGCCALRRNVWKERNFNENMLGGEDAEYAIYLHLKGFDIIYNPKAGVIHEHTIEQLNAGFWKEIFWRIVYFWEVGKLFIFGK